MHHTLTHVSTSTPHNNLHSGRLFGVPANTHRSASDAKRRTHHTTQLWCIPRQCLWQYRPISRNAVRCTSVSGFSFTHIMFIDSCAACSVENLRFAPPMPPVPFKGIRDATSFGAACFQQQFSDPPLLPFPLSNNPAGGVSEDCKRLSSLPTHV